MADRRFFDNAGPFTLAELARIAAPGDELAGFEMDTHDNAKIYVDVTWLRADELTVRSTRIAQFWRDHRVGGWLLVREKRVAGDIGLFGEPVQRSATRAKDVHFPTTTIRE